jgi:type I restriction enzyme S subunit
VIEVEEWGALGDHVTILSRQVAPDSLEPATPYVGLEHMASGGGLTGHASVGSAEVTSAKHSFGEGAVLYGKLRPYLNKVAIADREGVCSTDIYPLEPKGFVDRRYLALWLRSPQFVRRAAEASTGSMPRVNKSKLAKLPFPVPTAEGESRAVAIGEALDEVLTNLRRGEALVREIEEATTLRTVGSAADGYEHWPQVSIAEVADKSSGSTRTGPFGSDLLHSEFVPTGVPVLGIDNAVRDTFSWGERRFITPDKYDRLRRYRVHPGDVLITIMGTPGRVAVVPDDIGDAISTKHLAVVTPDTSRIHAQVLAALLRHEPAVRAQLGERARGAIMDGLNLTLVRATVLRLPPPEAQSFLIEKLAASESLREAVDNALDAALTQFDVAAFELFGEPG